MIKLMIAASLAVLVVAPAAAVSIPYSTDTMTFTKLGDTIGSQFDILTLNGVTGFSHGSGTYLVNNVDFTVGINATAPGTATGSFTDTGHALASTFTYSVPYTIDISSADTITLGGNTIVVDGVKITFNKLTLHSGGPTVSGELTATVGVPEPATWAMLVTGFGLVGFAARRRRTTVAA